MADATGIHYHEHHGDDSMMTGTLFGGNNSSSIYHDDTSIISSSDNGSTLINQYLFFIFPIIGFLILCLGGCILRRRVHRLDAEAIQRRDDRIFAAEAEKQLQAEHRSRLVEKTLITIKLSYRKKISSTTSRDRAESCDSTDLDSTMSSSCTVLGSTMRNSDEPVESSASFDCIDEEDYDDSLSDAENGIASSTDADVDYNMYTMTEAVESSTTSTPLPPIDCQKLETCAICLEPYKENDDVSYSRHQNCSHAFHTSCIQSWLADEFRNDCPCCRGPYVHMLGVEEDGDDTGSVDISRE